MTITFSFDNPREYVEVQEFFYNNGLVNSDPLANRPSHKFHIDLKGCMISKFQSGFLSQDIGESKFEIVTDKFKIKYKV